MGRQPHIGTTVVLVCGGEEVASWPLRGSCCPDLGLVDHLAQVQLASRRLGCAIELRHANRELAELVDLVGLIDVLPGVLGGRQVLGQAEGGEEGGVEEAVPPGDPAA